jgi:hypothetical protein
MPGFSKGEELPKKEIGEEIQKAEMKRTPYCWQVDAATVSGCFFA